MGDNKIKNVTTVLMLDVSYSMKDAIASVKTDTQAILSTTIAADKFAVNAFSDNAFWVYPADGAKLIPVTFLHTEVIAAYKAIAALQVRNNTNISDAIKQSNKLLIPELGSKNNIAYILLSDGVANVGDDPAIVASEQIPIYIAGLGPSLSQSNFTELLKKNKRSKFYLQPDAHESQKILNEIRAASAEARLALNEKVQFPTETYFNICSFEIAQTADFIVSCVWSDDRFHYTDSSAKDFALRIYLVDPNDNKVDIQPQIAENGFCTFFINDAAIGKWQIYTEYALDVPFSANHGVFVATSESDFNTEQLFTQVRQSLLNSTVSLTDTDPKILESKVDITRFWSHELTNFQLSKTAFDQIESEKPNDFQLNSESVVNLENIVDHSIYTIDYQLRCIDPQTEKPFSLAKFEAFHANELIELNNSLK
jgi:hypothetical protein